MLDRYYTVESRIRAVIASAFTVRPMVSVAEDIPDPVGKDRQAFYQAARSTNFALKQIMTSIAKQ